METLTLQQSTIRGTVMGKVINFAFRGSPAGLQLPPGSYLLRPALNNPVYGRVIAIEPLGGPGDVAVSHKVGLTESAAPAAGWDVKPQGQNLARPPGQNLASPGQNLANPPGQNLARAPGQYDLTPPSMYGFKDSPAPVRYDLTPPALDCIKDTAAPAKYDLKPPAFDALKRAPAIKFDGAPAIKFDQPAAFNAMKDAPAIKFDVSAQKVSPATAMAPLVPQMQDAASAKIDMPARQTAELIVISERGIAGNCLIATMGFDDLVESLGRAGAVKLVVV